MGLFQGLSGNMQAMDAQETQQRFGPWLLEGEQVSVAYKTLRDGFAITSHRIVLLDRQGASGKKARITSIPLNAIVDVTAETAGSGIDDSEIAFTYISTPRLKAHQVEYATQRFEFPKSFDIADLYRWFLGVAVANVAQLNADSHQA